MHPIAALALGDPNLPSDLALEPRDCLSLWQAMNSVSKLDEGLTPNVYFAKTPSIAIRDVIGYEKELKKVLVEWREAPESVEESSPFQKVVKALELPLRQALEEPEKEIEEGTADDFNGLFLPLLADLNAQGNLPAIIFNFSRDKVRSLRHSSRLQLLADVLLLTTGRSPRQAHPRGPRSGRNPLARQLARLQAKAAEG